MSNVFNFLTWSAVSLDVMACRYASAATLAARSKERLAKLVAGAQKNSRFYRQHLQGVMPGITPLQAMPVVNKRVLMANFDDWVTDPELKLADIQAFMRDPTQIAQPYLGRYLLWESSGTSNQPGVFVQDAQALAVIDALEALRSGTGNAQGMTLWSPRKRIAFVGAIGGHFASVVSMQRLRQINPWLASDLACFSILQPIASLVAELNAFAPDIVATYPTAAALLATEVSLGNLNNTFEAIWTGGETLSQAVRQRVSQVLGCPVRNSYGASEFLSIASGCRFGHLHVNADWVILEPVDEQGQPTPPDQPSHTTLLTNLANHVQPLIRYDLGDQLIWHSKPCACGSALPVIEVQGRLDDPLLVAGPHDQPVTLLPLALTTVLEDEVGVFDFQLRQRNASTLVLRLPLPEAQGSEVAARCRQALARFALQQGASPIHVVTEYGAALTRGRSGKALRVLAARGAKDAPLIKGKSPSAPR